MNENEKCTNFYDLWDGRYNNFILIPYTKYSVSNENVMFLCVYQKMIEYLLPL